MDDNQLWALFWKVFASLIAVITVNIAACSSYGNYKVTEMVKAGADPMRASCAIAAGDNSRVCAILAARPL